MAVRTITTRLAIDGETEYKAKLQSINAEIRLHRSELEKVTAEYAGQLNSLEALQAKERAQAEQLEAVNRKIAEHTAMLKKAEAAQRSYPAEIADLQGRLDMLALSFEDTSKEEEELTKQLQAAEANMQRAANSVTAYQTAINKSTAEQKALSQELDETRDHIYEALGSMDGFAVSIDGYGKAVKKAETESGALGDTVQKTGDSMEQMGDQSQAAVDALAAALVAGGISRAFGEIAAAIRACVDASVDFESAMAGVQKVTKMPDADLGALGEEIKKLSTEIPATATEIAAVAEASARLGVAQEDLLSFTRVMVDLGESSDLSAETAATALARFANIAGTASDDYERLGSVIVALGNNFATSESEITEMASRLASAGTLAGLTEAQIMGLSAAMASVGINAEAGGTAMTQTLTAMEKAVSGGGEALEQFAAIAGMSAESFSQAWRTDAVTAIQAFITGLGALDEQGESATQVLEALGLSGIRQSNMLKSLALASEDMTRAVETAGRAWSENTELAATAAARYETTEARLAMLNNAFTNVKVAIGDVLTPVLRDMARNGTDALSWAAEFIQAHPEVVSALAAVAAAVTSLTGAVTTYTVAVKVLKPLLESFHKAMINHPYGMAAVAITTLVASIGTFIATLPKADSEVRELTDSLEESRNAYAETSAAIEKESGDVLAAADALAALAEAENKTAAQKETLVRLVEELNDAVPGLNLRYSEQTDSLNMTAEAIREVARAEAERRSREADYERLVELYRQEAATDRELADAKERLAQAEADLNAMIEAGTAGAMGWETATDEAQQAVAAAKNSVNELTEAQESTRAEAEKLEDQLEDTAETVRTVSQASEEAAEELEALEEATLAAAETAEAYAAALKEQEKSGSLSLETSKELIAAGYESALVIDRETGAVTLNREEYGLLAGAKIQAQIATLEVRRESLQAAEDLAREKTAASGLTSAYWDAAGAKAAMAYADDIQALDLQIAALQRAQRSLEGYGDASAAAARKSSSGSRKMQTQAQKDLAAYKELTAELDHQRALELVGEQGYYEKLKEYRDRYLTDEGNAEEYRRVTEKIYKYDKALADQEAALWAEQTETLADELADRVKGIEKQRQSIENKLSSYGDLFTKDKNGKMSVDNIQEDIKVMERWQSAMEGLQDRGIARDLMDEVLSMDVEDAVEYGEKLLRMSDSQWEKYSEQWNEKQKLAADIAEQFYKDQLEELETEYDSKLSEALSGLKGTSFKSGEDTAQGLIDGIKSKEAALFEYLQGLTAEIEKTMAGAWKTIPSNAELAARLNAAAMREPPAVTAGDVSSAIAAGVNGMQTVMENRPLFVQVKSVMNVDSKEFFTETLPVQRAVYRANQDVVDDR